MIAELRGLIAGFYECTGTRLVSLTVSEACFDAIQTEALCVVYPCNEEGSVGALCLDGVNIRWIPTGNQP